MKDNEASLFVFIASIIIGILISLNINFNRTYNRVFLTTKQYQDAYNQRNKLRTDISNLQDNYDELYDKLIKFQYGDKNTNNVVQEIKSELDRNKMLLGETDVEGQGILITLKDVSNDLFYKAQLLKRIKSNVTKFRNKIEFIVINSLKNLNVTL